MHINVRTYKNTNDHAYKNAYTYPRTHTHVCVYLCMYTYGRKDTER